MEQKQKLVEIIMDSSLPQGLKEGLLKYVSQSDDVTEQVKEDVATVFDIYANLEQAVSDNLSGMATLGEQIIERLKMIDEEAARRMSAIADEFEPKVEEMKKELQELVAGGSSETSVEPETASTPVASDTLDGDLPPITTS